MIQHERPRHDFFICAALFMVLTISLGLLLRWQMAGLGLNAANTLHLRRTHSHIGFYGLLFPTLWLFLSNSRAWIPGRKLFLFYTAMSGLSLVAFLWQNYSGLSIFSSTMVLAVWIWFALKNRPAAWIGRDWLASITPSVLVAAGLIAVVATQARTEPQFAAQVARCFLSILLLGAFVPVALKQVSGLAPYSPVWFFAALVTSVDLTGVWSYPFFAAGPLWLAIEITRSVLDRSGPPAVQDTRLRLLWLAFALSLALTAAGLLTHSFLQGIAGVHFLILGPILMTYSFIYLNVGSQGLSRFFYEVGLIVMIAAILLQEILPEKTMALQQIAGISGTLILVVVFKWAAVKARQMTKGRKLNAF